MDDERAPKRLTEEILCAAGYGAGPATAPARDELDPILGPVDVDVDASLTAESPTWDDIAHEQKPRSARSVAERAGTFAPSKWIAVAAAAVAVASAVVAQADDNAPPRITVSPPTVTVVGPSASRSASVPAKRRRARRSMPHAAQRSKPERRVDVDAGRSPAPAAAVAPVTPPPASPPPSPFVAPRHSPSKTSEFLP